MSKTTRVADGDLYVDSRGRFVWVTGREKCAQDIADFLLNDEHSRLGRIEQGKIIDAVNAHRNLIGDIVHEAVDKLVSYQQEDAEIDELEQIDTYTVTVNNLPASTLDYLFLLDVTTEAGDAVSLEPFLVSLEHKRDPRLFELVEEG